MDAALPPACDGAGGDMNPDETRHSRTSKDEEQCAMSAPLPPPYWVDGGHVVADEPFHSRTVKDEEMCAANAPLSPRVGGNDDDDADRPARDRTTRARVFLGLGLALEVCATLWAFQQAVSAGALYGDVACSHSSLVVEVCDGPVDVDLLHNFTDTSFSTDTPYGPYAASYSSYWEEYVGCDYITDTPTDERSFEELCVCFHDYETYENEFTPCSWVALVSPWDNCYAQGLFTNSSDGAVSGVWTAQFDECWASNPPGTVELTITALVIALSSQLLEALVGFKYWKDTEQKPRTAPTLAASVLEALGVAAVSAVLMSTAGFYRFYMNSDRISVIFWLGWTPVTVAGLGALAEMTAECSDRASGRLPYLGAVGNALVWLGAALLEVLVTLYLLLLGPGVRDNAALVREVFGLFALELLALVAMWTARGLWTRAKLLRSSAKPFKRPLKKGAWPSMPGLFT